MNLSFLNFYKDKKVLITGDTGFKGSWLAIALKHLGAELYGYALEPENKNDNFITCKLDRKIKSLRGDINDLANFKTYICKIKPDLIFHLAAQPLVLRSYKEPLYTFNTNVMGSVNLLEICKGLPYLQGLIMVTTDKCYENKETLTPYKEDDALGGKDPYSASKAACEIAVQSYIHSYYQESTCNVASVRAGNVIGGGDWAENRIVPDIFRAIQANQELELRNPDAIRPWQFVLEPLFGYMQLMHALVTKGKEFQGGWNFGPDPKDEFSVGELAQTISEKTLLKIKQNSAKQDQAHEAKLLKLSIDKAKQELGWSPALSFSETIDYTVKGYKDELENPEADLYDFRLAQIESYIGKLNGSIN